MKKVISIILVILMSITTLPLTTFAADGTDAIIGDLETIEPIKLDNKTPCYGEYEIVIDEDEYATMAADQKDQYESNNSFFASTKLNSRPGGEPTSFSVSRSATLHRESWLWGLIEREVDEDYYRFDVFGNASVTISLTNIPTGCDYDLKLFQHDNIRYAGEEDITQIASSTKASNNSESITKTLEPGTYYLWIYSYNDECDDSTYYNLSVNVSYTASDVAISSLRYNKGAKAALWISDYDPCGIAPYSSSSKVEVGVLSTSTPVSVSFNNPYTRYFTSGEPIEQAVLYIWDPQLRTELRAFLTECYNTINSQLQYEQEVLMRWEFFEGGIGGAGTAGGIALSFVKSTSQAVPILNAVFTYGPIVFTMAKNIFAPSEQAITTKADLLAYIWDLRTALEVIETSDANEVVRIASTYTYSDQYYLGTSVTNYYFDFTPSRQSEYLYYPDEISSWNTSSIVHGTIYGIIDEGDIETAIAHGSNALPDINTSVVQTVNVNSSIPGELNVGEYHWYKFTASTSGTYAFYTEYTTDTYGELFSSIVPARSTSGRLSYSDDVDYPDNPNFRIEYQLTAGQTVYLRVRGYGWNETGLYALRVTKVS